MGSKQRLHDLKSLFAIIGLRDDKVFNVHADVSSVSRVERVLGIDKGRRPAATLCFCDRVKGECGFAGRFRPEYLDDSSTRKSADPKGMIDSNGPA